MKNTIFHRMMVLVLSCMMLLFCAIPASGAEPLKPEAYAVNENGETYGNDFQAQALGYPADLILATGEDGVVGYVRLSDLDDHISNPEEALQQKIYDGLYIPLYESDGETVVGRLFLDGNSDDNSGHSTRSSYTFGNTMTMDIPTYTGYSKSGVRGCTNGVNAKTEVTTSKSVDAGWIGIMAQVFKNSDGSLVQASSWVYNSSSTSIFEKEIYHFSLLNTEYYSQGRVKLWNIDLSGYWTYRTNRSPVAKPNS